eukprot:TRINITY_DN4653_c0_g1_i1.p1 TRINITY_DN4653_c0_g1~~TRINITY_DN4653_c0_g1_i1.p1  ORF type:complete len:140 (-),score=10.26 TRINITY_DN4653_c0_g1_i1:1639-2058(-)
MTNVSFHRNRATKCCRNIQKKATRLVLLVPNETAEYQFLENCNSHFRLNKPSFVLINILFPSSNYVMFFVLESDTFFNCNHNSGETLRSPIYLAMLDNELQLILFQRPRFDSQARYLLFRIVKLLFCTRSIPPNQSINN